MDNMTNDFLSLVRLGIGNDAIELPSFEKMDWGKIEALAKQHGLLGVLVDGVEILPCACRPTQTIWLRWIGEVMQSYEWRYEQYLKANADLAAFYNAHGFRMMILKGLACGINWPKPQHRLYGDIDIYLFGQYNEADASLEKWFKNSKVQELKIDRSHHHHTVFQWLGFTVENHFDFINVHHHKSHVELEKQFKELATNDSNSFELNGEKVYLPSVSLNALFLFKHLVSHFSTERATISQLLDWSFFVKENSKEIDLVWLEKTIEQFGMLPLFKIVNAICVEDLGFDVKLFPDLLFEPKLKDRVLMEIISPEFSDKEPKHIWKRVPFKYRRWKSNRWKHELCYKESMKSAFWSGLKSHLLKPKTI